LNFAQPAFILDEVPIILQKEGAMNFNSLTDVLVYAVRKEHDAQELYLTFRDMVKDPGAKTLLEDLANQELGHKNMIENALKTGRVDKIGGKKRVTDLHLSDHMIADEIDRDSSAQDVMLYAMKQEQASYNLYRTLLDNYQDTELSDILSHLVKEELKHKETLEREYEDHFMQWM
jgi:rubrerythrin